MAIAPDQTAPLDDASPAPAPGLAPEQCAVARCAEIVSGKWTLLLIRDLADGPMSFSDLQSSLAGISPRTLCDRLKVLARDGFVSRTRIKALPPRSIYELTDRGFELVPVIETMRLVGEALLASQPDVAAADAITADECCG
ncbi:MAG: transcriptional regulator, HxlR family [Thermoleophilia bacterium]|nr:transcriptional regulator, HxlR family [Thermoleophilia bacterium]